MTGEVTEKLRRDHAVEGFDCGTEELNQFLVRHALQSQASNASQTYVAVEGERIIGYYSLVVGEVAHAEAPERLKKGLARHPIPLMILARLAVSLDHQGEGVGASLLKDAMLRTLQAAEIAGVRAQSVHAKEEATRAFYLKFDFDPSPTEPMHLFLLCKELKSYFR